MRRSSTTAILAVGLATVAAAGCSSSASSGASNATLKADTSVTGGITVFAAASLQGAFTTLGKQFEAAHPGTTVKFSFGASSSLATEITSGSPAQRGRDPRIGPG